MMNDGDFDVVASLISRNTLGNGKPQLKISNKMGQNWVMKRRVGCRGRNGWYCGRYGGVKVARYAEGLVVGLSFFFGFLVSIG